ncbi:MAG: HAD-IC family P-type ATPase, partial [Acidobacteria bacterium]|nr:HAD-IC family P-type ATPase [Acidobacteriota bacterium]
MALKWFSKSPEKESERRKLINERENFLLQVALLSPVDALKKLNSSSRGLSSEEAEERLDEYGLNELSKVKRIGFWADIYEKSKSPLVIQLLLIFVISAFLGEFKSTIIVFLMILLSVGLSYILDKKSFKAVESLGKRVQSRTFVVRDGTEKEIKMSEVVPGDIVLLNAGSIVPADIRILSAKDFFVSESALTGESMPVEKNPIPQKEKTAPLELKNVVFLGTSVTSGSARGVVISTGVNTIFGAISERLTQKKEETGFDKGIKSFTYLMIRFMAIMVCFVFLIVGLTKGNWLEALLFGLAVAVGLTPEMLPMIITVNLAKGALSMAERKVIVKSLPSIQNFGAIDILCTDKTGTLTQDKVVLERYVDIIGNRSEDVLQYAYLNSYFQTGLKNLIDRAILEHIDLSVSQCKRVDELPFDFERRRMSVVVEYEGDNVLICKGAVEEIYDCCSHYQIEDEVYPLIDLLKVDLFEEVERLNKEGFRVLGIAYKEFPVAKKTFSVEDERGLILLGYIA